MRAIPVTLRWVGASLAAAVLLAGCGGDDPPDAQPTAVASADASPDASPAPDSSSPGPTATGALPSQSAAPLAPLDPSEPFGLTSLTLVSPDGDQRQEFTVYVAATSAERGRGLMDRADLPEGTGMVFLFPNDSSGAFYMYRTLIPLSIAFFDAAGQVVSVLDMEPCTSADASTCERYNPEATYRGALEVNQGAFEGLGVTEGWTVELPSDLPTPT